MQLQLDREDIHLLKEIAEMGEVSPKVFALDRRLERLELEGYLSSVRQDPPRSDAAPGWVYRLMFVARTGSPVAVDVEPRLRSRRPRVGPVARPPSTDR